MENEIVRYKVINAILSDNNTRYAGAASPQKTGRFNIPKKCYSVLSPKFGDTLFVIQDNKTPTSMIITKKPNEADKDKIVGEIQFGSGIKTKKNRLRINQNLAKMFGACDIGVSIFDYNKSLALRVCPKVPKPDFDIYKATTLEDLAKYVLWPGRTIRFLSFASENSTYSGDEFSFKLLGSAFYLEKHNEFLKMDTEHLCSLDKNCEYCKDLKQFPIYYRAIYFPILYNVVERPTRPGVLKFVNGAIKHSFPLIDAVNRHYSKTKGGYWSGPISYNSSSTWKFGNNTKTNKIEISKMGVKTRLSDAELGWLLTMRKDFKKFVSEKEQITMSVITNKRVF